VERCGEANKTKHAVRNLPAGARARVWPTSTSLPGLQGGSYHFYHPLRLAEWLTTGLELSIHDIAKEELADFHPYLQLGDTTYELEASPSSPSYFRLRLLLGDTVECDLGGDDDAPECGDDEPPEANRGLIVLSGLPTMHDTLEVELVRQQVTRLSFTKPGVSVALVQAPLDRRRLGIIVDERPVATRENATGIDLLADLNDDLAFLSCSRASIVISIRYNVAMPEHVSLDLDGHDFMIENVTVLGATAEAPADGWASANAHELYLVAPPEPLDEDGEPRLHTASSNVQVRVDVVCVGTLDVSAWLAVSVAGGDLESTAEHTFELRTRTVQHEHVGDDVAKLQIYLSQILVADKACLPSPAIDGAYGKSLSLALWRFCLRYAGSKDWPADLQTIRAKKGEHALDFVTRDAAAIDTEADALHRKLGGPIVDAPLLAAIVAHYKIPYIAVRCRLFVAGFEADPLLPFTTAHENWGDWDDAARSRVPPVTGSVVLHVRGVLESTAPGNLDDIQVQWAMLDAPEYELQDGASGGLGTLLQEGVHLVPTGELTQAKHHPVVAIQGGASAQLALGGAHDLTRGGAGLDCALVQWWLTRFFDPKGNRYLVGKKDVPIVDGEFGNTSKSALKAFIKQEAEKNTTYAQQLRYLSGGNPSASEAAQ
jgi:hypothetical protein